MQSQSTSHKLLSPSGRPAAREMRLSSSFKAMVEAASGANTPTSALLNQASDIISRSMRQSSPMISPRGPQQEVTETPAGPPKLRSCLSLKRHSESPGPTESATEAVSGSNQSAEHKGLHWKPDLVMPSATDHKFEARELQARYLKLEGDLKDSEDAKAMLQKQVHRVQEAVVHSRDEMESAQRLAIAAETKAAAAEAKAAAAEAKSDALSKEVLFAICFACCPVSHNAQFCIEEMLLIS